MTAVGDQMFEAAIRQNMYRAPYIEIIAWRVERLTPCGAWLKIDDNALSITGYPRRIWRQLESGPSRRYQPTKEGALRDLLRRREWYAGVLDRRAAKVRRGVNVIRAELGEPLVEPEAPAGGAAMERVR